MTLEEYMRELVLMSRQYGQEEELYPLINILLREYGNVKDLSVRDVHNKGSKNARKKLFRGYASYPDLAIVSERLNLDLNKENPENDVVKLLHGCVEVKTLDKIVPMDNILDCKNGDVKWILDYPHIVRFHNRQTDSWGNGHYTNDDTVGEQTEYFKKNKQEKYKIDKDKYDNYDKKRITRCVRINTIIHKDIIQLLSELFLYGKVLYTDGLVWYYLELKNPSTEEIYENCNLKSLLNNIENKDDTRASKFVEDICQIKKIKVLGIEIGNLEDIYMKIKEDIYMKIKEDTNNETAISLSVVEKIIKDNNVDTSQWNRLIKNLDNIKWTEENHFNDFDCCQPKRKLNENT